MVVLLFLSFLLPVAIGVLIGLRLLPPQKYALSPAFRLAIGGGLGLGTASLVGFLVLPLKGGAYFAARETLLLVLATALGLIAFRKGAFQGRFISPAKDRRKDARLSLRLIPAVTGVTAVSAALSFLLTTLAEPHGKWDAFLIWNLHARFLFRSGAEWMDYFRSGLDWTHPDYPLLLPLAVERAWEYCGGETLAAPAVIAAFFTFSVAGLLASALGTFRGRDHGLLGTAVLLASPLFVLIGASQLADVPLSFYMLGAVALLFLHDRGTGREGALATAGLFTGLAAWTKNEGVLFCALFLSARPVASLFFAGSKRALKEFLLLAGGASPALLVLLMFKIAVAPQSDLIAGQSPAVILEKLADPGRYGAILLACLRTGLTFTQGIPDVRAPFVPNPAIPGIALLALYFLIAGKESTPGYRQGIVTGWAIVLLMTAGYFFVLVITPHDLKWHLMTSLNRLFLQLWPLAVFLVFMSARSPGPAEEAGAGTKTKGARKRR